MKIIEPQKLSLLTRVFEHDRQPYLAVAILALFPFDRPSRLLHEASLWELAAAELGKDATLDLGMPKLRGELLITGEAYAPVDVPRRREQLAFVEANPVGDGDPRRVDEHRRGTARTLLCGRKQR